ncbi:citrate-binding protein-like protein [Carex littledalei]|uniref:Citrate-binding protein-like protein n=1 Tax=Carex littledalei TaxID=544730 RepID=A0A833QVG7_9POAL|nr:citrate-binding protein-like protein [Carex littledalei]
MESLNPVNFLMAQSTRSTSNFVDLLVCLTRSTLAISHNFVKQQSYNVPLNERYSLKSGVRRLWVYYDDKPFQESSGTKPHTEIRMRGYDYSNGVWQFEGYGYVPNGTTC